MKRITFITTGQPSTNPRLVREVNSLIKFGYEVKVIYCFYQEWASKYDLKFISDQPNTYIICGGTPLKNRFAYLTSRVRFKLANLLSKWTMDHGLAESAISRTHLNALKIAKSIKTDIYIAHNLGALPAAGLAAKNQNCKVGYDAEDMHSAQFVDLKSVGYLLNKFIEEKYFPKVDYFTAASPLIAKNYQIEYPYLKPILLNNVFPKTSAHIKLKKDFIKPIKLFWFSQTIGKDRGLEDVIEAINILRNPLVELHLLGSLSAESENYFNNLAVFKIQYCKPISPNAIFEFSTKFDVGLALEPAFCLNNNIALSNKIFTYLTSGLAIIASNTTAQEKFIIENPTIGRLYRIGNTKELSDIISTLLNDNSLLNEYKTEAYRLAQSKYNWEYEEPLFISTVEKALNS